MRRRRRTRARPPPRRRKKKSKILGGGAIHFYNEIHLETESLASASFVVFFPRGADGEFLGVRVFLIHVRK